MLSNIKVGDLIIFDLYNGQLLHDQLELAVKNGYHNIGKVIEVNKKTEEIFFNERATTEYYLFTIDLGKGNIIQLASGYCFIDKLEDYIKDVNNEIELERNRIKKLRSISKKLINHGSKF
jgi:hypothetical protein